MKTLTHKHIHTHTHTQKKQDKEPNTSKKGMVISNKLDEHKVTLRIMQSKSWYNTQYSNKNLVKKKKLKEKIQRFTQNKTMTLNY